MPELRCRPDDVARVVAPYVTPGRGAFVTVIKAAPMGAVQVGGICYAVTNPSWFCEGWVRNCDGEVRGPVVVIDDHCLEPLRKAGDSADTGFESRHLPEVA